MCSGCRPFVVTVCVVSQLLLAILANAQENGGNVVPSSKVPYVVGQSAKDAVFALKQAGLVPKLRVGKEPSRPDEANRVYATDPAPGTPMPNGAAVQLTIFARVSVENAATNELRGGTRASSVRGAITVPALVGSSAKDAKAALKAAGLNPRFFIGSAPPASAAALHVYAQRPEPGTAVAAGDSVNIMIYSPGAAGDAVAAGAIQEELSRVAAVPYLDQADEFIDPRSGLLSLTATDMVVPAGAINLVVRRTLQQTPNGAGMLGRRWRLNWESRLFQSNNQVIAELDGQPVVFQWDDAAKRFTSASGDHLLREGDDAFSVKQANGVKHTFNSQGRLIERDERNGNKITLIYDANGKLTSIAGPRGTWLRLRFNENGRLNEIESSTGCTAQFKYSPTGGVPGGNSDDGSPAVHYTYSERGALQRIVHPRLGATKFAYDNNGRVARRSWADGSREEFAFDYATRTLRHTDHSGRLTITHWSEDGRRQEIMNALGAKTTTEFDERGRPERIAGPTGQFVRFTYDALGRVETSIDADGRTSRYEYVGDSKLIAAMIVPDRPPRTFTYDAQMNLVEIRVGSEVVLQRSYFPDGLVRTIKEVGQGEQRFTYNASGNVATASDALNGQVQFEYDQRGNLTRVVNSLGGATTCSYDAHDRLLTQTDPTGKTTLYEYTTEGNLSHAIDPTGQVVHYEYDKLGRPLIVTDPSGKRTTYEYDAHGRSVKTITGGEEESYGYDAAGNLASLKKSSGANWTFRHDVAGQLVSESGPLGDHRSWRYDAAGRVIDTHDALNRKTEYSYDNQGRLSAIRNAAGQVQRLEYGPDGRLLATVDHLKRRMAMEYDEYGRVTGLSRNSGRLLKTEYRQGQPSKVSGPDGSSVSYSYDTIGQRSGQRYANGESFAYKYDALGQVVEAADGLANIWKMSYTPRAELASITAPSGAQYRYTYTHHGDLDSIVDALGHMRNFEYDGFGRRVCERDALDHDSEVTYGPENRIDVVKSPDGKLTQMTYDLLGRLTETSYPEGPPAQFEYDIVGNLTSEKRSEYSATYRYDELDRLVEAAYQPIKITIRYSYDDAGRRSAMDVEGQGRWTYRYDDRDRLVELRDPQDRATRFEYDDAGRAIRQVLPNGITTTREYDGRGRVLSISTRGGMNQPLMERRYQYNTAGNLVKEVREGGVELGYEYDGDDRLISVTGANGVQQFTYDAVGNRLRADGQATYDAADQLQHFGQEGFTYDDQGRMTARKHGSQSVEYLYGAGGHITAVKQDGKVVSEYGYDARGRRIWKKLSGQTTHYVYDGAELLFELNDKLQPIRIWTPGPELDRPLSFAHQEKVFYPITDAVGSVVALADQAGAVTARWDYEPFGAQRPGAGGGEPEKLIPYGFAGGKFDAESGLYYFRARYYDPALGRFLTRDPLFGQLSNPASLHSYQYAFNNPLRYRDASGAAAQDIADAIDDYSGGVGHRAGSTIVGAASTAVLNTVDALASFTDPSSVIGDPASNRAFGNFLGQRYGGPAGDFAGRMATSLVSEPLRFGTGFEAMGTHWDQGNYFRAAGNLSLDALRAVGVAAAVGNVANKVNSAAIAASAPPTRVYTAQGNAAEILKSGRMWGQTEGSVYASANTPSNWSWVNAARNTRGARKGDTIFVFEGEAAKLFTPHPIDGPFSAIKRLGGQVKAGFGDIQITKWRLTEDLKGFAITEAKLLPGQHAGPPLSLPGGFQMDHAQRLAGRKAFDNTLNALTGVIGGLGGALIAKNSNDPAADEDSDPMAAGAGTAAVNGTSTPGGSGAIPANATAGVNAASDPNDPANWNIPVKDTGGHWDGMSPELVDFRDHYMPKDIDSNSPPPDTAEDDEFDDLLTGDDTITLPDDPDALVDVPDHPQTPGISGELEGDLIPLPDDAGLTLDAVLAFPGDASSVLGPLPEPDPNAKWPICPKCGERHDPNE